MDPHDKCMQGAARVEANALRNYGAVVDIYGLKRTGRILISIMERVEQVTPLEDDPNSPTASDEDIKARMVAILIILGVVKLGRQGREE